MVRPMPQARLVVWSGWLERMVMPRPATTTPSTRCAGEMRSNRMLRFYAGSVEAIPSGPLQPRPFSPSALREPLGHAAEVAETRHLSDGAEEHHGDRPLHPDGDGQAVQREVGVAG